MLPLLSDAATGRDGYSHTLTDPVVVCVVVCVVACCAASASVSFSFAIVTLDGYTSSFDEFLYRNLARKRMRVEESTTVTLQLIETEGLVPIQPPPSPSPDSSSQCRGLNTTTFRVPVMEPGDNLNLDWIDSGLTEVEFLKYVNARRSSSLSLALAVGGLSIPPH
jgi:hypothetical protein